jgi:hypothetical protein
LPEAYAERQEGVHVHFRVEALRGRGFGCVRENFCAVFVRPEIDVDCSGQEGYIGKVGVGGDGHLGNVWRSMFVHVVKLVELPERIGRELIPSVVRLQTLDEYLRVWMDAPDFVAAFQPPRSTFGQRVDAEVGEREFVDEVIEGRAEIMEAIPDDETKLLRDGFREFEVDELLAALSVEMTNVSVRFSLSPLTNLRLKSVQVIGGPI